jgi:hypothetical protein
MSLLFFDAPHELTAFDLARSQYWDIVFFQIEQNLFNVNERDSTQPNAPTLLDIAQDQPHFLAINRLLIEFQAMTAQQVEEANQAAYQHYQSLALNNPFLALMCATQGDWQNTWNLINTGIVNLNLIHRNKTLLDIASTNAPQLVELLKPLGAKAFKELQPMAVTTGQRPLPPIVTITGPKSSTRWSDIVEEDDELKSPPKSYLPLAQARHNASITGAQLKYVPPHRRDNPSESLQQPQPRVYSPLKRQ